MLPCPFYRSMNTYDVCQRCDKAVGYDGSSRKRRIWKRKASMKFDQAGHSIRCEWGEDGTKALSPTSDVVMIVDVLSFSTCVDVATGRGAVIHPYRWKDMSSTEYAARVGAALAGSRRSGGLSLSPASLMKITSGTALVLPSPNGATLSLATGEAPTLAGCIRNAKAVAMAAMQLGERVSVIPAGERWPGGRLRPALEDWLGAGAIIEHLSGTQSPEATAARDAYRAARDDLSRTIHECQSGLELIRMGFEADVALASEANVSEAVPRLVDSAYTDMSTKGN